MRNRIEIKYKSISGIYTGTYN